MHVLSETHTHTNSMYIVNLKSKKSLCNLIAKSTAEVNFEEIYKSCLDMVWQYAWQATNEGGKSVLICDSTMVGIYICFWWTKYEIEMN